MTTTTTPQQYIELALEMSTELLTAEEFIMIVGYPIDMYMIDHFYNAMEDNQLIYIGDEFIQWMGYQAANAYSRKMTFMKLLREGTYRHMDNDEYETFRQSFALPIGNANIYPEIDAAQRRSHAKHLLLTPDGLRNVMMQVGTIEGDRVRAYYIALEKLFKIYTKYQSQFRERSLAAQTEAIRAQLAAKDNLTLTLRQEIEERDARINRIGRLNEELTLHKQFVLKEQTLYVGSTYDYALQGLFKVSKTSNVKQREITNNTSHPYGDKFVILHTIRCGDAAHFEKRAHHVLQHFRPYIHREFIHMPYDLLICVLEKLAEHLDEDEQLANETMEIYLRLSRTQDKVNWVKGAPMEKFGLPAPPKMLALPEPPAAVVEPPQAVVTEPPTAIDLLSADELLEMIIAAPIVQPPVVQPAPPIVAPPVVRPAVPAVAPPAVQPAPQVVVHVFKIGTWSEAETKANITAYLLEYKASLGRAEGSWKSICKQLVTKLKPHFKQPKVPGSKDHILRLCIELDIPMGR